MAQGIIMTVLTQLRFIHNRVIVDIQWMVHHWWGAGALRPLLLRAQIR